MRFYDRINELKLLSDVELLSHQEAQMTVLIGRRRIGKTELTLKSGERLTLLYFFVARKSEALLCDDFRAVIEETLQVPIGRYTSFSKLFHHVMELSKTRAFTLIIDEFQDFGRVNSSIFSELQREWDLNKGGSHLNLIVSGSIYSMMHKLFEDSKEPLFSRAGRIINLQPFTTDTLKEILRDFNPSYTAEDLLALFTVSGGVAWYISLLMDYKRTVRKSIYSMLTEVNSPFINEGKNVLIEEFGADYSIYFSILICISEGQLTRKEIENKIGMEASGIGSYLERLEKYYGLIERHQPIFAKSNSRKVRYTLCDNFLTLWFRFFFKYQAFVENGALKQLARLIERDINMLEDFILERYFERKLRETGDYTRIGRYWDRKGENEIDLIAVNEIDKVAWVYEVKRNANKYDEAILRAKVDNLLQNCSELRSYKLSLGCLSLDDM